MRTGSRVAALLVVCSLVLGCARSASAAIVAASADDVCEPADDPCTVSEVVEIIPGSVLDFGQRTLRIESGGVLDYGNAPATVRCGKLEVATGDDEVAIRAGATEDLGPAAPARRLEAVRQCSNAPRDCFSQDDCHLGSCDIRRCVGDPTRTCSTDAFCNLGTCGEEGLCGYTGHACSSNADCQVGPCGAHVTCSNFDGFQLLGSAEGPLACTSNADCQLGDCSVGDGTITLAGATELDLDSPSDFVMRSAADVTIAAPVDLAGGEGEAIVDSGLGNVHVDAPIRSSGLRGALMFLRGGGDVAIDAGIEADGQNRGGQVGIFAGGDLLVHAGVVARTTGQRDHGGEVFLFAGQDLRIEGGTAGKPVVVHGGFLEEPETGVPDEDGGWLYFDAGRDIVIDAHSLARTDGDGALLSLRAERDFELHGSIVARTFGAAAHGPLAWIIGGRDVSLSAGSEIELSGNDGAAAGLLTMEAERDLEIDATVRFAGAAPTPPIHGDPPGLHAIGCVVRVGEGADVLNSADDSHNQITARGVLAFEDGASWVCEDSPNVATVRTEDNPLVLAGSIDPPMEVEIEPTLPACPNCIDPEGGDRVLCNDRIACTRDICTDGSCSVVPDDSACSDDLYCDGPAFCSAEGGCQNGPAVDCSDLDDGCYVGTCDEGTHACVAVLLDGVGCDDGDECTVSDFCEAEVCMGVRDVACGDCGNTTIEWGEGCDDGDDDFAFGDLCSSQCQRVGCGHPTGTTGLFPTAGDALYVLRSSVDLADCPLVLCDVNASDDLEASDALLVLKSAVGLLTLTCPPDQP